MGPSTRWTLFWAGLALSAAVTGILWWLGIPGGALFLAFPFLLFGFGGRGKALAGGGLALRRCARCDFTSSDPDVRFCPRDGSVLD